MSIDSGAIIITARDARQLQAGPGNPHLIVHRRQVRVVRASAWRNFYVSDGALLIMTKADLAEVDP